MSIIDKYNAYHEISYVAIEIKNILQSHFSILVLPEKLSNPIWNAHSSSSMQYLNMK